MSDRKGAAGRPHGKGGRIPTAGLGSERPDRGCGEKSEGMRPEAVSIPAVEVCVWVAFTLSILVC